MIIVTDRGAASAECAPPRAPGKRRMRAPTSAVRDVTAGGLGGLPRNFFYIKVPICDFLAFKMVKVKPATVGKLGIFL
jgi:hypothetical protein